MLPTLPIINPVSTPELPTFQWVFVHGLRVDDIVWDCPFVHGRIVAYPSEKIYCNLQAQSKDKDDAVKRHGFDGCAAMIIVLSTQKQKTSVLS